MVDRTSKEQNIPEPISVNHRTNAKYFNKPLDKGEIFQ